MAASNAAAKAKPGVAPAAPPAPKKRGPWLYVSLAMPLALVLLPSTIVLMVAMVPTLVARIVDPAPGRQLTVTVGSLNFAGSLWFMHDLWSAASEIARLAEAARSGKAAREELAGSTITITSLGPLGGIATTPVINHPEVAIVGVNRIVERPVVRDGLIVVRKTMNLSSSFDHRVVDGMDAAEFIQSIRGLLECPSLLFIE